MSQALHDHQSIPKNFRFAIHRDRWDRVFPKNWDKTKTPVKGLVGKWTALFTEKFTEINPYCNLCFTYNRIRKSANKTKAPFYFCKAFCKNAGCASYDFKVRTEPGPDCQFVDVYVDRIGDVSHGPGQGVDLLAQEKDGMYVDSTGEIRHRPAQGAPINLHDKDEQVHTSESSQREAQAIHEAEYGVPTVVQAKERESYFSVSNESEQSVSQGTGYYLVLNQAHSTLEHLGQEQFVDSTEQHYIISQQGQDITPQMAQETGSAVSSIQMSGGMCGAREGMERPQESSAEILCNDDNSDRQGIPHFTATEGFNDYDGEKPDKTKNEFFIHLSRAEWNLIKPRGKKSYQLIKPWTKVFQEKLSWIIPDCEIIFKMNKIKKEGSRKIYAPYFNGRGVCRCPGCATYHFSIQATPKDDDSPIDIYVQRKGSIKHGILAFEDMSRCGTNDSDQNETNKHDADDNNEDQLNESGSTSNNKAETETKPTSDEGFQTEFSLLLTHSNWLTVKPTAHRPMQLDRVWTDVFAKKFSQKNPYCNLLFKMNKIKKENTRKLKCPYFNGRAVCRKEGCATYSFHIQDKPVGSDSVMVKVTRRGQISHDLQDIPEDCRATVPKESNEESVKSTGKADDDHDAAGDSDGDDDDDGGEGDSSDSDSDATIDTSIATALKTETDGTVAESKSTDDAKSHVDFASKLGLTASKTANSAPRLKIYVVKSEKNDSTQSDVHIVESEQEDKKNVLNSHSKMSRAKWLPQKVDESFALYINRDEWNGIKPRVFKPNQLSRNWTDVLRSKFEQKATSCLLKFVSNFVKIPTSRKSGCSYFRARALCKYIGCAKYVFRIHNEPTENDKLILLSVERFGKVHHKQQPTVSADEKRKIKAALNSYAYANEETIISDSENEGIEEPEILLPRPSNNTSMSTQDSDTNERRRYKLAKRSIDFSSLKSSEKYVFTLTREEWDQIKPKASNDSTQGHLCEKWTELFGSKISTWNPHCTLSFYYNRVKGKTSRKINCQYFCAKAYCKFTGCASFLFRIYRPPLETDATIRVVVKRYGQIRHSSINNADSSNDIVLSENQVFNINLSNQEWDSIKPIKTSNRSLIGVWSKLFHSKFSQVNPYCLLTFKTNRVKAKDSKKKNAIFFRSNAHCKIPGCVKYLFSIDEEPTEHDENITVKVKRLGAIHHINGIVNSQNIITDQNPFFEIELNNTEWRNIMPNVNATKGKRFLSGKWSEVLIAKFFQQNPYCVLSFKRCSIRGRHNTKATLYMHAKASCKFPGCAMYEFFIQHEPLEWEESIKIQVQRHGNIHHGSGDTKDVYRNRKALMAISGKFVSKPRKPTIRKRKSESNIVARDETSLAVANALATFQSDFSLPYSVSSYSINNQMFLQNQLPVNSNEQRNEIAQNISLCTDAFNVVSTNSTESQPINTQQYMYSVAQQDLPKVDKEFKVTLTRAEFEKIRPSPTHPQFTGDWTSLFLKKLKQHGVPCFVAFNYNKVKKLGSRREHAPYFRGRGTCKYQNCCSYLFLIQGVPCFESEEVDITVNRQGEINHTADMMDEHLKKERKMRRPNKRKLEVSESQSVDSGYVNIHTIDDQERSHSSNDLIGRNSALPTVTVPNNYIITDSYVDNIVFSANNVQMVTGDNSTMYITGNDVIQPGADSQVINAELQPPTFHCNTTAMSNASNLSTPIYPASSHNASNIPTALPGVTNLIAAVQNTCNVGNTVHSINNLTGNVYNIPHIPDTMHGNTAPNTAVYNLPNNATAIQSDQHIIASSHSVTNITENNNLSGVSHITDSISNIPHTAHIVSQFTESVASRSAEHILTNSNDPSQSLLNTSSIAVSEPLRSVSYPQSSLSAMNKSVNVVSKISESLPVIPYQESLHTANTSNPSVSGSSGTVIVVSLPDATQSFSNTPITAVSKMSESLQSISFSACTQSLSGTSIDAVSKMSNTLRSVSYLTDQNISHIPPPVMHNTSNIAVPVHDVSNITAPVHDESTVLTPLNTVKEITPQHMPGLTGDKNFDAEMKDAQEDLSAVKTGGGVHGELCVYNNSDTSSFTIVDKDNVVIGSVECVPVVTSQSDEHCMNTDALQTVGGDAQGDLSKTENSYEYLKSEKLALNFEIVSIFEEEYDAAFTINLTRQEWEGIKPTGEIKSLIGKWSKLFQAKIMELGFVCVLSFHYNRVKSKESRKYKCPYFRGKARCRTQSCCRYKFVIQKEPAPSDDNVVILVARFGELNH